jgi:proliferating cell nuclear antigen PCNA
MHLVVAHNKLTKFCEILSNIKHLAEFVTLTFSEDGIYSQGMTMDHCAIYELTVNEHWFDDYEFDKADAPQISISTNILSKILATRQPSQHLVIAYNGKPDKIKMKFGSLKKDGKNQEFPKEFIVPLMDVDNETLSIPEVEYSAEFGIGSKSLMVTNEQLSLFDETLTMRCSEENITMCAKGNEGELSVTLFSDVCEHINEYEVEEGLDLSLDFSIKHFQTFCRFLKVADEVQLGFKNDYPMKFNYNTENDELSLVFYLAPKIKDDA